MIRVAISVLSVEFVHQYVVFSSIVQSRQQFLFKFCLFTSIFEGHALLASLLHTFLYTFRHWGKRKQSLLVWLVLFDFRVTTCLLVSDLSTWLVTELRAQFN